MYSYKTKEKGLSTWGWIGIFGVGLVLLLVIFMPRDSEPVETVQQQIDENVLELSDAEQKLNDITEDPNAFIGQKVTVEGEVEDVFTDQVFVLDAPGLVNDQLLVVTNNPFDFERMEDQDTEINGKVRVEGTMNVFAATVTQDIVGTPVDPDAVSVYVGEPYLQAEKITFLDE